MLSFSRTSWPRPRIGATASLSGSSRKTRSICSSTFAVRIDSASIDGSSGANAGSSASEPSAVCSSPDHRAERAAGGRAALRVAPSSSSASSQPSCAPARYSCRMPSVASIRPPLDLVPAGQRRDVREAARGQEAQQLELRVHARLDAPERLQDQLLAEHHRRVRLLDADRPHVDGPAEAGAGRLRPAEARTRPGRPGPRCWSASGAAARGRARGRPARRRPSSRRPRGSTAVLQPSSAGPQPERHLVGLVRARREARLDQAEHEQRRLGRAAARARATSMWSTSRVLEREPALGDDPVVERLLVEEREVARGDGGRDVGHASSSSTSWNQ